MRQRARPAPAIANGSYGKTEHIAGTAPETERKVQATVGLYAPNPLGYTRATMVDTMGCDPEKGS